jgi:1-acyl-sn-glycerol-3-phosphate acyltransferase
MFRTKFKRKIFTALGAIPEKRYAPDRSILFMKKALDLGYPVGVFPSGERSWTGIIQSFKPGTIQMFRRFRHIPVLPVRIEGYYFLWPRWSPCMLKSKTMIYYTGPLKKRF